MRVKTEKNSRGEKEQRDCRSSVRMARQEHCYPLMLPGEVLMNSAQSRIPFGHQLWGLPFPCGPVCHQALRTKGAEATSRALYDLCDGNSLPYDGNSLSGLQLSFMPEQREHIGWGKQLEYHLICIWHHCPAIQLKHNT